MKYGPNKWHYNQRNHSSRFNCSFDVIHKWLMERCHVGYCNPNGVNSSVNLQDGFKNQEKTTQGSFKT